MTGDESLLQILAAADTDDEDDMAIRAALFVTLRDLDADNPAFAKLAAPKLRARYRQHPASGQPRSLHGVRRRPCTFFK
jgi:hypothetical protein